MEKGQKKREIFLIMLIFIDNLAFLKIYDLQWTDLITRFPYTKNLIFQYHLKDDKRRYFHFSKCAVKYSRIEENFIYLFK